MQTFLPFESYRASAEVLDDRRLGKQRVEAFQMASAILDSAYGWQRHPAVEMWRGHGGSLCVYGLVVCQVWRSRGFKDTMLERFVGLQFLMTALGERIVKPGWVGDSSFHDSHQSNLIRKDAEYYASLFADCQREDIEYVWPSGVKRMGVTSEVRQKVMNKFTCHGGCGGRKGFTNRGDGPNQWWVCSQCGRPTEQWLTSQGDEVLNMFRGGPVDGYVYPTSLLLSVEGLRIPVVQYQWTTELITSETTGRVARVWRYQPSQTPDSVALVGNTTTSTGPTNGVRRMSETTESAATETAQPAPAPQPVDVADLRPRREAIKASRTVVAKEAGITVAQLYRVETGGKRTTADEATNVREALTRLEAAHAEAAAAQAAAAPAAAPAEGAADPS